MYSESPSLLHEFYQIMRDGKMNLQCFLVIVIVLWLSPQVTSKLWHKRIKDYVVTSPLFGHWDLFCYDKTLDQRKIYETEKNINNLFALIVSRPSYGSIISKLTVLEKYSLQFFVFLTSLRQSTEVSALVRSLCFFRCLHLAITSVLLFNKFVSG